MPRGMAGVVDTSSNSAVSPPSCLRRESLSFDQMSRVSPVSRRAMHTDVSWLYLFTPTTSGTRPALVEAAARH